MKRILAILAILALAVVPASSRLMRLNGGGAAAPCPTIATDTGYVGPAAPQTTVSATGNIYIDSLIVNHSWPTTTIHVAFPTAASDYSSQAGTGSLSTFYNALVPVTTQKAAIRQIFLDYERALNIKIVEMTNTSTEFPDVRIAYTSNSSGGTTGFTNGPNGTYGASIFAYSGFPGTYLSVIPGNLGHELFIHEFGHALSLNHPFNNFVFGVGDMPCDQNYNVYTIMSYRTNFGIQCDAAHQTPGAASDSQAQSLMMDDIAALQVYFPGSPFLPPATYAYSPTTGQETINGCASTLAPAANIVYRTVFAGSFDFSAYSTNIIADLRPATGSGTVGWIQLGGQLANINGGLNPPGNIAMSKDTVNVARDIITGSGNDAIIGNAGPNVVDGGAGTNSFQVIDTFANTTASGPDGNGYCHLSSPAGGLDFVKNIQNVIFSGAVSKTLNGVTCALS